MEILKKAIAAQNKKYEGTKEKKNHLTSMKMKQIAYGICKIKNTAIYVLWAWALIRWVMQTMKLTMK
jgi:hypothetical protein